MSKSEAPRLGVLISGGGRTLKNISAHIEQGKLAAAIGAVISSGPTPGAEWARSAGHVVELGRGPGGMVDAAHLMQVVREQRLDYLVLAGYLKVVPIPPGFEERIVNIHPALLPSFGGKGMYGLRVHRAVLEAGCKVSGCSVHFVTEEYDRGPIIAQATCPVLDDDTPDALAARVFEAECRLYPRAIADLVAGRLEISGNRVRVRGE